MVLGEEQTRENQIFTSRNCVPVDCRSYYPELDVLKPYTYFDMANCERFATEINNRMEKEIVDLKNEIVDVKKKLTSVTEEKRKKKRKKKKRKKKKKRSEEEEEEEDEDEIFNHEEFLKKKEEEKKHHEWMSSKKIKDTIEIKSLGLYVKKKVVLPKIKVEKKIQLKNYKVANDEPGKLGLYIRQSEQEHDRNERTPRESFVRANSCPVMVKNDLIFTPTDQILRKARSYREKARRSPIASGEVGSSFSEKRALEISETSKKLLEVKIMLQKLRMKKKK